MMVWVFLFSSCTVEDDLTPSGDEYLSLTFTQTLSRADLSQEGAGSFSEGDCIGLYVACEGNISYRELTLTGGEWYPRLKRSEFGKGRLTLSAHYPVLPESSRISPESSSFSVASVQSGTGKGCFRFTVCSNRIGRRKLSVSIIMCQVEPCCLTLRLENK